MNRIDDILEQLKGQQPVIDDPDALTDCIMDSLPDLEPTAENGSERTARTVRLWQWLSIAASILLIIGIGTTLMKKEVEPKNSQVLAKVENVTKEEKASELLPATDDAENRMTTNHGDNHPNHSHPALTETKNRTHRPEPRPQDSEKVSETHEEPYDDPNLHYAAYELKKDTLPYQDPARVDEFIAKMAAYNNVKEGELECTQPANSKVVSSVYVFPDNKEIDVFGRLLQVACWYSDETPGYLLNFSHQQFFFELKDTRKHLQYRWIAERVNGKILLYGTNAPIGAKESSACYQEYRDELMHTKSINKKPREI